MAYRLADTSLAAQRYLRLEKRLQMNVTVILMLVQIIIALFAAVIAYLHYRK